MKLRFDRGLLFESEIVKRSFRLAKSILYKLHEAIDCQDLTYGMKSWFEYSFGPYSRDRFDIVKYNIETLMEFFEDDREETRILLYADRGDPRDHTPFEDLYARTEYESGSITFDLKFFGWDEKGKKLSDLDRAGIVIHELTHMLLDTEDHGLNRQMYRSGSVGRFAKTNPGKAVECAYCYELFSQSLHLVPKNKFSKELHDLDYAISIWRERTHNNEGYATRSAVREFKV